MAKILQSLICFTVILAAARTERRHFFYNRNVGGLNGTEVYATEEKVTLNHTYLEEVSTLSQHRRHRRNSGNSLDTVFEDQIIPEECLKNGYCEHVDNYPTKEVDMLLKELGDSVDFNVDILNDDYNNKDKFSANKDKDMCDYEIRMFNPESGLDRSGSWKTVVNSRSKPIQGFRIEVCTNPKGSCSNVVIQEGYRGNCTQQFSYRQMLIVHDQKIKQTEIRLPTACYCGLRLENKKD